MARRKKKTDPFAAERKKMYEQDLQRLNQAEKPVSLFPDRPTNNIAINALKDVQDFGTGISSLVSSIPSFIRGDVPLPSLPELGKAIVKGVAQSYGQQAGLNAGAALQSFVKHPMNFLDVIPGLNVATKGKLAKTISKASKMGEIPRYTGGYKVVKGQPLLKGAIRKSELAAGKALNDEFVTSFSRQSDKFSKGHMNTWGHIYGSMMSNYDKATKLEVMKKVKDSMGIKSTKDLKPEQMWDVVEKLRAELPKAVKTVTGESKVNLNMKDARLVKGMRTPEYQPKTIPAMRQAKKAFTGSVLTQPSWLIGNRVGDVNFALGAGRNPIELYQKGLGNLTEGLVRPEDLGGFYRKSAKDVQGLESASKIGQLDKKWNDIFFGTEGKLEQAARRGAFYKNMEDIAKDSLKTQGVKADKATLNAEVRRLAKQSPSYDAAIKKTRQQFGDYRDFDSLSNNPVTNILPDWAKQITGEVIASPFIKYPREATKITAHQAINNPYIFQGQRALGRIGNQFQEQQQEYVNDLGYNIPEYARGGFVRGLDETGRPEILNAGKLMPQMAVADVAKAIETFPSIDALRFVNPVPAEAVRIPLGLNFTGRPASTPNVQEDFRGNRIFIDPVTQEQSLLNGSQLPPGEGLNYAVSQALRNFTKLGALEKWAPTRSYDTRMWETDPTRSAKPEGYFLQNLGFGNVQKAVKPYEWNQESIRNRYLERTGQQPQY